MVLLADISTEIREYGVALKDITNPVYISLFTAIFIAGLLYIILKYWILPQQRRHAYEKSALELKNARLMALFADLDPDPILRIDSSGRIIFINPAAAEKGYNSHIGKDICEVIPSLSLNAEELIGSSISSVSYHHVSDRHYAVQATGIKYLGIAQIYMHDITELKENQQALEKAKAEIQAFSQHLQQKIEMEKQSIARELHDGVGQNLVLVKLTLQRLLHGMTGNATAPEIMELNQMFDSVIKDLRGISHSLKPRMLEEMGLVPALSALVENTGRQSGIRGCLDQENMNRRLSNEMETAIYRIAQEALSNMVKYSGAKEFYIRLINKNQKLRVVIADDGHGFDTSELQNRYGMGIRNMKERAAAFGGSFRISSSEEDGTLIVIEFPVN